MLTGTFDVGFQMELMAKDLQLCVAEADRRRIPLLIGSSIRQVFTMANAEVEPGTDAMAIVQIVQAWAGVHLEGKAN